MPVDIQVSSNGDAVAKALFASRRQIQRAERLAIGKVARGVRTDSTRALKAEYKTNRTELLKRVSRVNRVKAVGNNTSATITYKGTPLGLISFAARQTRKGVTVTVKSGRKLIRHGFIAKANGKRRLFVRGSAPTGSGLSKGRSGGGRRKAAPRRVGDNNSELPIDQVFTAAVSRQVVQRSQLKVITASVRKRWELEFQRAIKFVALR